jgi:hypothetical protein
MGRWRHPENTGHEDLLSILDGGPHVQRLPYQTLSDLRQWISFVERGKSQPWIRHPGHVGGCNAGPTIIVLTPQAEIASERGLCLRYNFKLSSDLSERSH